MAKITIIEGSASPLPIFSRELAHTREKNDPESGPLDLMVTITTASFGSSGSLEGVRSYWVVDEEKKTGTLHMYEPEKFDVSKLEIGKGYIAGYIQNMSWQGLKHEDIPATHKAILSEWLRERWSMSKLRGRIS